MKGPVGAATCQQQSWTVHFQYPRRKARRNCAGSRSNYDGVVRKTPMGLLGFRARAYARFRPSVRREDRSR
jgi:hypothetical protein